MEDCFTDERLQQETLYLRQWTDEYVERPESGRDVDEAERNRRLAYGSIRLSYYLINKNDSWEWELFTKGTVIISYHIISYRRP